MADDLTDTIATNAAAPKRVSGDQGSAEQHPIADQIAADKYAKSQTATASAGIFKRVKMEAPGSV